MKELFKKAWCAEEELKRRPKGERKKARMSARLMATTPMTWRWIAQRLAVGYWRTAFNATQAVTL